MDIRNKIIEIYSIEQLSAGNTSIHFLHPMSKLITTFVFIVTVISFDRHDFSRVIPFIFYPSILIAVSEIPYSMLFKRFLVALPFCLLIGFSNLFLERNIAFEINKINISYGVLSFCVILYRVYLCVTAIFILAAVTPLHDLTNQLRKLKIPDIFILMFEMTYRYIGVLFAEASSMRMAYILRSSGAKSVDIHHSGSFIGCLLIRSFNRAERIYSGMKCRGYMANKLNYLNKKIRKTDIVYLILICFICLLLRFIDVVGWITSLAEMVI